MTLPLIGMKQEFDNTKMKDVLGIKPRPFEDSILDMAYSMIENGTIKKTDKYTGPKSKTDE